MKALKSSVSSFLGMFFSLAIVIYCSVSGVFPAAATIGKQCVTVQESDGVRVEEEVLADGVTRHGVTRVYIAEGNSTYQLSERVYSRGVEIGWSDFWPNGNLKLRAYEAYVGSHIRYELFDEAGLLVRSY